MMNLVRFAFDAKSFSSLSSRKVSRILISRFSNASTPPEPVKLDHEKHDPRKAWPNKKPPILVFHGLFGSKINWRSLSKQIADLTGRSVYALDVRDHGSSGRSPMITLHGMCVDAINFAKTREIEEAVCIGHSLGGRAFIQMAFLYPQYIEKLIIVDTSPTRMPESSRPLIKYSRAMKDSIANLSSNLTAIEARRAVDVILREHISDPFVRGFLLLNLQEKHKKLFWQCNLDSIIAMLESNTINHFENLDSSMTFNKPALFVYGGKSDHLNPTDIPEIKKIFPKAEFLCIEDGNHYLHVQHANQFIDLTANFVNR